MAKSHTAAPGTREKGGVCMTLDAPFGSAGKGSQGTMAAPFNAPRTGGDNGLPTKIYDNLGGPGKGAASSSRDVPGTILTNPKGPRR